MNAPDRGLTFIALLSLALLAGCAREPDPVLGTLERDRISLPSPAAERIARVAVREGDTVAMGDALMELESTRIAAQRDAAVAERRRAEAALAEARHGPLPAAIAEARARLAGAEGLARNARQQFQRTESVVAQQLLPAASLDQARATRDAADADVAAAREALRLLTQGTRAEQVAQAEASVAAARAQVERLAVDLERTRITAPRAGTVETLPFEAGDQPAVGAALATLLVGDRAYARVYVPQSLRLGVAIGTAARVTPQGSTRAYEGRVRAIRSEAAFTPYYALAGRDVSRLSWLAEIELGPDADALPVGVPVRAEFPAPAAP
jgi:HlyD family secretion protein